MEKIRKCIIGGIEYWHTEALRLRAENTDLRNANQILRDALDAERAELAEIRALWKSKRGDATAVHLALHCYFDAARKVEGEV